jgi:integrase/recombinase XerD
MLPSKQFKGRYVPIISWPVACQAQWCEAHNEPGLFEKDKPARHWRPATMKKTADGFGHFISWMIFTGTFDRDGDVVRLVTRKNITGFVKAMASSKYAPYTIFSHIQEVYDASRVMDPTQDWSWLNAVVKKLRSQSRPVRNKLARLQSAQALERLGRLLMHKAETTNNLSFYQRALMFRDGLMISILIRRPFRLKNFASLTIESNLIIYETSASFLFLAEEMKGKRPFEVAFPPEYFERLQIYLAHYRPYLLCLTHKNDGLTQELNKTGKNKALWISNEGRALTDHSLRNAIQKRTKAEFDIDMTPHLFRDASVTSLIRHAPESAKITRSILGHTTIDITNAHYNQARMIESSLRHTHLIESLTDYITQEVI